MVRYLDLPFEARREVFKETFPLPARPGIRWYPSPEGSRGVDISKYHVLPAKYRSLGDLYATSLVHFEDARVLVREHLQYLEVELSSVREEARRRGLLDD